ncbi:MAG: HEPN domain-containing protein [Deltaproteobacteria bacterium]|nr:HEPN domain-containing protein [Deltaproteobacteria bacterium]
MPERFPPEDPREWLNRAQSNLVLASMQEERIYLEDLCFNAQQAAEKAIKALLIHRKVEFPYVHDIAELLTVAERSGQEIPPPIRQAERLTRFAVFTRYPGVAVAIRQEEHREALRVAGEVVQFSLNRTPPSAAHPQEFAISLKPVRAVAGRVLLRRSSR